ncbi:MAG: hypothetical protein Q8M35_08445 [Pseudohongiella sp.]|nr:hypothetical protein [Pseudohongiella sp.]
MLPNVSINPRALSALSLINDLRRAAFEALERKHKYPALLLFYSFIDICASLAQENQTAGNRERFESFLSRYALTTWSQYKPYDLWAARSSLLHAYSPLGYHTEKPNGATPIFYFVWPETKEEMTEILASRGYTNFLVLDIQTIKHIGVSAFNSMWLRVESDSVFESTFLANSEHLLKDVHQRLLENELVLLDEVSQLRGEPSGG